MHDIHYTGVRQEDPGPRPAGGGALLPGVRSRRDHQGG